MKISVFAIYALACALAVGAAFLNGFVLSNAWREQQLQREYSQRDNAQAQLSAGSAALVTQLERMRTHAIATSNYIRYVARRDNVSADRPLGLVSRLNRTLFSAWVNEHNAPGQLFGVGSTMVYGTPPSFVVDISTWSDPLRDGRTQQVWAVTSDSLDSMTDVDEVVFPTPDTTAITQRLYSFDYLPFVVEGYRRTFFDKANPWISSDGNSFWYFTYQVAFLLDGVNSLHQAWDHAISWRDRLRRIRLAGSEMFVTDSRDYLMAATHLEEEKRNDLCYGAYVSGALTSSCIDQNVTQHNVTIIRDVYNVVRNRAFADKDAPAMNFTYTRATVQGTDYFIAYQTVFSSGELRLTMVWYQPWSTGSTNEGGILVLVCAMAVISTAILTILGIFGVLRPLRHIGSVLRAVSKSLSSGSSNDSVGVNLDTSPFLEVDQISTDFKTIIVDFLGFQSSSARDNTTAPKDSSRPIAVLFTDVQSSTKLWGTNAAAMGKCLSIHNEVIRSLIERYGLYEVKTVGDSFMVVGSDIDQAVAFALDIQREMDRADWSDFAPLEIVYKEVSHYTPSSIPPTPHNQKSVVTVMSDGSSAGSPNPTSRGTTRGSSAAFHGIRVRVGLHYGPCDVRFDEVTKGYDYFGPTVNVAARIESIGNGGQTLVSHAVMSALSQGTIDNVGATVKPLGAVPLRGVAAETPVIQLNPTELNARVFPPLRLDEVEAANNGNNNSMHSSTGTSRESSRNMRLEDLATLNFAMMAPINHSAVTSGTVASSSAAAYINHLSYVLVDLFAPIHGQQKTTLLRAIAKGWGIRTAQGQRTEIATMIRQLVDRLAETKHGSRWLNDLTGSAGLGRPSGGQETPLGIAMIPGVIEVPSGD